jgi:ADP-glucose pyrophosphorylase
MDAIVLCGGKGTRLASVVSDVPKPLALVNGRPFLDYLLTHLISSGLITRIILATGHMADKVAAHYGDSFQGIPIAYSEETEPLGTGGAILLAIQRYQLQAPCFALNGDSFVNADLIALKERGSQPGCKFALTVFQVENAAAFGTVTLEGERITSFLEKTGETKPGLINAGVYYLDPQYLLQKHWASKTVSLEYEMAPLLQKENVICGMQSGDVFIDIGTPATYALSEHILR